MSIVTNGNFDAATAFTPLAGVVGDAVTDVLTKNAHGLLDGQEVVFTTLTGGTGLTVSTKYYVRDRAANTFKVAATRGGAAVAFSTDVTDATVVRTGHGVPTGWTIAKAGSSEILAGKEEALSPTDLPVNTYSEMAVDATPGACSGAQAITLVPDTHYRLSLKARWAHEDPAQVAPAHAPTVTLQATAEPHYLTAAGAFQAGANAIPIPVAVAKGSRLAIVFKTPATHTAYTLTIDKGTMDGTAGYNELVRISGVKIEPYVLDIPSERPENNDAAFDALPQNS